MKPSIQIKRVYEAPDPKDGYRVLVDRLWPRGVKKESLKADEWAKDLAPSTGLRQWYDHQPDRFEEFTKKYRKELASNPDSLDHILRIAETQPVTLLYSAKDTQHNQAVVLCDFLKKRRRSAQ